MLNYNEENSLSICCLNIYSAINKFPNLSNKLQGREVELRKLIRDWFHQNKYFKSWQDLEIAIDKNFLLLLKYFENMEKKI